MNKTDDVLRQLGWQRMIGNPDPNILWYIFTGRSDLTELNASDLDNFEKMGIHMDCVVRLIRDADSDTPEELRPFWRITYKTSAEDCEKDSGLSFDELEAFYKKIKELIRKETRK